MSDRDTTTDLLARLAAHYGASGTGGETGIGGLFVTEVGVNGKSGASGRCDALYAGYTSASGRILIGHEVKASRADWLTELKKVGKADLWADSCHAWYVVAPPGIIHDGELPHGWGLLSPSARRRTRMETVVSAEVRSEVTPSWDVVRSMMARADTLESQSRHAWRETTRKELIADAERAARAAADREARETLTPEQRQRLFVLDQLERRLGIEDVGRWARGEDTVSADQLATALQLVGRLSEVRLPDYIVEQVKAAGDALAAARSALDELETPRRVNA